MVAIPLVTLMTRHQWTGFYIRLRESAQGRRAPLPAEAVEQLRISPRRQFVTTFFRTFQRRRPPALGQTVCQSVGADQFGMVLTWEMRTKSATSHMLPESAGTRRST